LVKRLWFAALLMPAPAAIAAPPVVPTDHKLVIISIDGLDARFFHEADRLHLKIPTLRKLAATGVWADVVGMVPTETWPSHAVIVTGVPPGQNGVLSNEKSGKPGGRYWFENELKVPAIWRAASEKGLRTAAIYWPTTVGAHIDFNCPEYGEGGPEQEIQFDQVAGRCTPGLIDKITTWDNSFIAPLWDDRVCLDVLRYLLSSEKPDLTLVHLAELDAEQHETGAMSVYSRKVLENDDELIGAALLKLPAGTVVAIVSDHGFDSLNYVLRPRVMLKGTGLADMVFVRHGLIGTTSMKAATLLRKSVGVKRSGISREVPIAEVHRLAPDLRGWVAAFDSTSGYIPTEEVNGVAISAGNRKGVHGLWPTHDSSRAVFILSGPGVRRAVLRDISILDEAPTFADILGVNLGKLRGVSLWKRAALP